MATSANFKSPKQDHSMEGPGAKLRQIREKRKLTMRDVENASENIVERRGSSEYKLGIGRLFDFETNSVVPSVYRLYSLCAIYRLDYREVLTWYGVTLEELLDDAMAVELSATHVINFHPVDGLVDAPLGLDPGIDLKKTVFLARAISKWGTVPLALLNTLDTRKFKYAFIGMDDWAMYPVLRPGSLVLIDDSRKKIVNAGWSNEYERPIYFLEHRDGYACGWCTLTDNTLVLQPHTLSGCLPQVYRYSQEIEVLGQVSGVAMLLDPERRRNTRS